MDLKQLIERDGYSIVHDVVSSSTLKEIAQVFSSRRPERNALKYPEVARFVESQAVSRLLHPLIGRRAFAVRSIFFEKSPEANWKVTWHQDLTIAVKAKHELPGFGPWTLKGGVTHVQPPADLMANMVSLRLHLDANTPENGSLKVIPQSHLGGRLSEQSIDTWKIRPHVECLAPAGSVLLMRPLLLHSSSAATFPVYRRVLHIEFANFELPAPLEGHERIALGT